MAKVYLTNGMDLTTALRKFKKQVVNEGILDRVREKQFFMSKKEKQIAKRKAARKNKK